MSTGDFIGLINADDYLMPHALTNMVLAYDNNSDVIYGNTVVCDLKNKLKLLKKAGDILQLMYSMQFIHQTSLIRKKAYDKYGTYNEVHGICMDYDFLLVYIMGGSTSLLIQFLAVLHMVEHRVNIY